MSPVKRLVRRFTPMHIYVLSTKQAETFFFFMASMLGKWDIPGTPSIEKYMSASLDSYRSPCIKMSIFRHRLRYNYENSLGDIYLFIYLFFSNAKFCAESYLL